MNCLELDRESKRSAEPHQSCVQFISVSNMFDGLSLRFYVMYLVSLFLVFVVVNFYYLCVDKFTLR